MTKATIIISIIAIVLFLIIGVAARAKGNGTTFSLSNFKIPSWFDWWNFAWIIIIILVIFLVRGCMNSAEEYTSHVLLDENRVLVCKIPPIPEEFKNEITFTRSWRIKSKEKDGAIIYFPGATLVQGYRNDLTLQKEERRLKNRVPLLGTKGKVVSLAKNYRLEFVRRGDHVIYAKLPKGAIIGDVENIHYKLTKKEEVK